MPVYCVEIHPHPRTGRHLVHNFTLRQCTDLSDPVCLMLLGRHTDGHDAVNAAKTFYPNSCGCIDCCPECGSNSLPGAGSET